MIVELIPKGFISIALLNTTCTDEWLYMGYLTYTDVIDLVFHFIFLPLTVQLIRRTYEI